MIKPEQHNDTSPPTAKGGRFWMVAGALVAAMGLGAVADRCAEGLGRPAALESARRIWLAPVSAEPGDAVAEGSSEAGPSSVGPVAFWAIKDFDLSAGQIERGVQSARLLVLGDPEVLVYWNGILVHADAYHLGQEVRVLNVGQLLEARNRVVLEGRSSIGSGGLLAALWVKLPEAKEPGEPLWVTDASWQVARSYSELLLRGFSPLADTLDLEPPRTWSRLDLGRWQPLVLAAQPSAPSWPSRRLERTSPLARVVYQAQGAVPGETEPWPGGVLYTFADPVRGCLGIGGESLFPRRAFFFEDPTVLETVRGPLEFARENGQGPAAIGQRIVSVPGARRWLHASPRRFTGVLLEGVGPGELVAEETVWVQPCAAAEDEATLDQRLRWSKF